ncbi:MAG: protein translocase subunit SecF [Candidatus Gracilibacteria bacterium]|nr:protein translocase subunit SecF [Candidatus Gracilibacteria bacterium]
MDILKHRYIYIGVSAVLFVVSLFLLIFSELNLGIDMTGGIQLEYDYTNSVDLDKVASELELKRKSLLSDNKEVINSVNVYSVTGEKTIAVVVGFHNISDDIKLDELKKTFKSQIFDIVKSQDNTVIEAKYINIGKTFGDYIKKTAYITLAIALVTISLYVAYAFSGIASGVSTYSFAVITILTLFHDIIISTGAFIFVSFFLPEFQIDTFFITALLTILGYSINDTIVVFDRIRSNLDKYVGKTGKNSKNLYEIINLSISETIVRSIYTSLTLFFVLLTIFIFGPESINGFILALLFGTIFGTYSSIFIASPLLYEANKNKTLSVYKKIEYNPDDKIVV